MLTVGLLNSLPGNKAFCSELMFAGRKDRCLMGSQMKQKGVNAVMGVVDRFNEYVAKGVSILILITSLAVVYEVFARYALSKPTFWSYEVSYMMSSAYWFLGGAWTLKIGRHVTVDVLYSRFFSPRTQSMINILFYLILFLPVTIFVTIYGSSYAWESWKMRELSHLSPWRPAIYPFKTLIPITFFMLTTQGIVELIRCIWKFREQKGGRK
jgi:TRAP-type mannitol/chloroaromatic compound transport system permease small subunit